MDLRVLCLALVLLSIPEKPLIQTLLSLSGASALDWYYNFILWLPLWGMLVLMVYLCSQGKPQKNS